MLLLALMTALAQPLSEYKIGAGDTVNVVVHGHEEAFKSTEFYVGGNGNLSLPYVGEIKVSGLTPFEAEKAIRDHLKEGYILDPHVSVTVKDFNSQQIEVIGDIEKSGVYPIDGPTTVRQMMIEVGVRADQSTGKVTIRRGEETFTIDISSLGTDKGLFSLQGGDVVDVAQGTNVFLFGEVANPGAVKFEEGLTAAGAFGIAGGATEYSRLRGTYIVRGKERIAINLKRIIRGKESDVPLEPGDRLVVPTSAL